MFTSYSKLSTAFLKHWIEVSLTPISTGTGAIEDVQTYLSPMTLTGLVLAAQDKDQSI